MAFEKLRLIEPIAGAVKKEGYTVPTPIQAQAIPHLLNGKDLIGIAQTGTGKTAAFILPVLQKLTIENKKRIKHCPRVLILTPTRELAAQIGKSCATYGIFTKINYAVVYGGVKQGPQVKALSHGIDILVATPGRLMDLMEQKYIRLDNVQTFILDEADRMLDMGFVRDIRKILPSLPKERQTIMFSATMSKEVSKLAHDFLKNPERVNVSPEDLTIDRINQELFFVERTKKIQLLKHLMRTNLDHVLIFTRTKAGADKVAKALNKERIKAESIHSDKSQGQRTRVLDKFKKGKIVLVATDVAARGIDVDGISHVINYDLPNDSENYIHRIGRTARAGAEGTAYSFCDETEKSYLRALEKVIGKKLEVVDHPFHSDMAQNSTQKPLRRGGSRGGNSRGGPSRGRQVYGRKKFSGRKDSDNQSEGRNKSGKSFRKRGKKLFGKGSGSGGKKPYGKSSGSRGKPRRRFSKHSRT